MHLCYDTVAAAKWKCAVLIIEAEGQCSPYWRRLLFFVPARGNSALVITCNQWRLRVEAALLRYFVSHNWPCVLEFIQSKGLCGATRHIGWGCVCVWTSQWCLRFLPLCPDAVPHACSLLWLCLVPSPSFSLSGFESKPGRTERRFSPSFHLGAAAAVRASSADKQWKHQCSITSGAAL